MTQKKVMHQTDEEAISKAVDLMEDSALLTNEELDGLKDNPSVGRAVGDLLDVEQATLEAYSPRRPDVEQAWQRFVGRHPQQAVRRAPLWLWTVIGSAAIVLVVLGLFRYMQSDKPRLKGDVVLTADNSVQRVSLVNAQGDEIDVTDKADLSKVGAKALRKDELVLTGTAQEMPQVLTLNIPRGQIFKLTLSDGTEVWLNNDTRLTYPSQFKGRERRVRLEGEAYFKVHHDASHPFVVETGQLQARVLGTEFNICARRASDAHVTLIDGSVMVKSKADHARLVPGKDACLQSDGTLAVKEVDIDSYVYWRDGYFYFDGATLETIMEELGRWYNMNVVFGNEEAKGYEMHFLCERNGDIDQTIKLINIMGKVRAERHGNTLYIY